MRYVHFAANKDSRKSPEWHAWHARGVAATDAGAIAADAGLLTDPPPWLHGKLDEIYQKKKASEAAAAKATATAAMERGRLGEAPARRAYEKATGVIVNPTFGEMDAWPMARASFDGMSAFGDLVLDIICPQKKVHDLAKRGVVAAHYRPRLAHLALVAWGEPQTWTGDETLHFASFVPEDGDLAIVEIRPATDAPEGMLSMRDMAARLLEAEKVFWNRVIESMPPAGEGWSPLAHAYLRAAEDFQNASQKLQEAKRALEEYAKAKRVDRIDADGLLLYWQARKGPIDYPAAVKKLRLNAKAFEAFRKPGGGAWTARPWTEIAAEDDKAVA